MIKVEPCNPQEVKVTLLKGGASDEREVSLVSGNACAKALREEGFAVTELDPVQEDFVAALLESEPDVVFIALHGKDGEDGCVQGLCEIMDVAYTGSGVLASALAMDKARAKAVYKEAGLETASWISVSKSDGEAFPQVLEQVGDKCVVKPTHEGSALGVHIVENEQGLIEALEEVFTHDSDAIIEKFVPGTEVTIAVLGNDITEALPVIEIVPQESSAFYDYEAKYAQGGARHIIPARISDELTKKCQDAALLAHEELGCRGVSRTDMIIDAGGVCWVLETNTIPGMTATSLLPDAANNIGIGFNQLCRLIVELGLEEYAIKHK